MAERYCKECGGWHDLAEPWPHAAPEKARSDLPTPYFTSDNLGAHLINHADGKRYDSRSAFYKAVKSAGCEVVGNETPKPFKPHVSKGSGADIKRALEQLKVR
jgi:hypothetical protein